ncbi:MAG: hypothetical protein ACFUZC_20680 [Chthoniobacteraceae bacterium]
MNPPNPDSLPSANADARRLELNRRVRGVRFARMHYRLAASEPFVRREDVLRRAFAFRCS